MSRTKRAVSLAMILVVVAGLVTGIALLTAKNVPAEKGPGFYENGDKLIKDTGPMITVGELEVSYVEYRSSYLYWKNMVETYMGQGAADFWETDIEGYYADLVKQQAEADLINTYVLLDRAAKNGISLSQQEIDELTAALDEEIGAKGDGLEAWLKEGFYSSEEMYRNLRQQAALVQKVEKDLTEEVFAANKTALMQEAITAKHILVSVDAEEEDASSEVASSEAASSEVASDASSSEAEGETNGNDGMGLMLAQNLLDEINDSDDKVATFDKLMIEFTADSGLDTYPDGYTFTDGVMVAEFYDGAKALAIGEISKPILSEHGYHIIMRLPLDEQYVRDNLNNKNAMIPNINTKWGEAMNTAIEAAKAELGVTFGKYYDAVALNSVL